jgi:hypothetical protein
MIHTHTALHRGLFVSANALIALVLFACSFMSARPSASDVRSFDLSASRTWAGLNLDPDTTTTVDGPATVTVRLPDSIAITDFPSSFYSFTRDSKSASDIDSVTLSSNGLSITDTHLLATTAAVQLGITLTRIDAWKAEQLAYTGPEQLRTGGLTSDSRTHPAGFTSSIGIRPLDQGKWTLTVSVYFEP